MNAIRSLVAATLSAAVMLTAGGHASAQPTETVVTAAAVTLDANDLPTGFAFVGETMLAPDIVSTRGLDSAALGELGFSGQYVSVYQNPSTGATIRSYVSTFGSPEEAEQGFAILETDEADSLTDGPLEMGDGAAEITTGTFTLADGDVVSTADATFRRDALVIGVAIDGAGDAEPDTQLATDLAGRLDARATAVINGEMPAGIDPELARRTLSLGDQGTRIQAGYIGPVESEQVYDTQGSALSRLTSSWVEAIATDSGAVVMIGNSDFESDADADSAASHAQEIFAPLSNQAAVDVTIEGRNAISAWHYTSEGSEGDNPDSMRILFAQGSSLIVVDVAGASSAESAQATAVAIVKAQITCVGGETCQAPTLTETLN